jgi:hypothetical protein
MLARAKRAEYLDEAPQEVGGRGPRSSPDRPVCAGPGKGGGAREADEDEQWERLRRSLPRPSAAPRGWRAGLIRAYEEATGTWTGCD